MTPERIGGRPELTLERLGIVTLEATVAGVGVALLTLALMIGVLIGGLDEIARTIWAKTGGAK